MDAAGFEGGFAGEVLLVVVADIRARHVLVADAGDALTDFLALHAEHIAQHAGLAKILFREVVG